MEDSVCVPTDVMKTPYRGLGVCPNRRDENSLWRTQCVSQQTLVRETTKDCLLALVSISYTLPIYWCNA